MRIDAGIRGEEDSRMGELAVVSLVIHCASLHGVTGTSVVPAGPAHGFLA